MNYRHEYKHEIAYADMLAIRHRLSAIARADEHAAGGSYIVRSLYFDSPEDSALLDKINGVGRREKFRLRYYNCDTSHIRLEKKGKQGNLCSKETAAITAEEAKAILLGNTSWMVADGRALVRELHLKMLHLGLLPRAIVEYEREPFVFPPGNVRVTLDYGLRTSLCCADFLSPGSATIPVGNAPIILEVKWGPFLPSVIRSAVQLPGRRTSAFSKYAACRIYG